MQAVVKPWGKTRLLHLSAVTEVWHASIKAGGRSSWHRHERKHNAFHVVSGELRVHAEPDSCYHAQAGQSVVILAGRRHQFEAISDVELIETYWIDSVDPADIIREIEVPLGQ